jgi:two-component system chemotaxis sensor kinase CheA
MIMNSAQLKVLDSFREEAGERVDRIVDGLLAFEKGTAGKGTIDALFRDAHSIKGSAGMMGLDEAYEIGHAIEDVLAQSRESGSLAPGLVEPLLQASDALRRAVAGEIGLAEPALVAIAAAHREAAAPTRPSGGPPDDAAASSPERSERRSMRVEAERVDRLLDAVGESVVHHRRLGHALHAPAGANGPDLETDDLMSRGDRLLVDLQDAVIKLRTVPFSSITGPLPRAVRDLAAAQEKEVDLHIEGAESQLDRVILEGTSEAIVHLLRNAIAHGIELPGERERAGKPRAGRIELRAEQRGDRVAIEVRDDGRGVAQELVHAADGPASLGGMLARAGMSTAASVTSVSGRGVGLDAVKHHVESVGGRLEIDSQPGRGTTVSLLLPMNLALLEVLMLERGQSVFGVPISGVAEAIQVTDVLSLMGRPVVRLGGEAVPLIDLVTVLGGSAPALRASFPAIILAGDGRRVALSCDQILGEDAVVVKPLGRVLADTPGYLGGAVIGDGRVALVLDPLQLLSTATDGRPAPVHTETLTEPSTVLVVDDQFTVRELQRSILEASGYRVETARDGREAWERLSARRGIDLIVTDLEMPEMDGLELTTAVRNDAQISSLPIVIVTSRNGGEDERRGLDAGADAYIVKERFDQRALLDTVEQLIGR